MRVVIAWPYLEWGGAQTYLASICRHFGPDVQVACVAPSGTDPVLVAYLAERGIATHLGGPALDVGRKSSWPRKAWRRVNDAMVLQRWVSAILRVTPDIVHVDLSPWTSCIALARLARRTRVVSTLHTPMDAPLPGRGFRPRARWLARTGRVTFLGANERAASFFGSWLGDGAPLPCIESGVDDLELAGIARTRQPDVVVGAGQLVHRKGIDTAIDALAAIRLERPAAELHWLGAGPEFERLVARAVAAGIGDHVRVEPGAERRRYLSAVAGAAVYVQPSREEGLPAAMLEAMAIGVPVVASAVGSVSTIVHHARTGLLIAPDDPDALARATLQLLADPDTAERLGAAGAQLVRARCSARAAAPRMLAEYQQLLSDRVDQSEVGGWKRSAHAGVDRVALGLADAYIRLTPVKRGRMRVGRAVLGAARRVEPVRDVRCADGRVITADLRFGVVDTYFLGQYEPGVSSVVGQLLHAGDVCVDAGACFGWYTTLFAARVGPSGHVHAIEPNPVARELLDRTLARNRFTNITVHPYALGDQPGHGRVIVPPDAPTLGHAMVRPPTDANTDHGGADTSPIVKIETIDQLVRGPVALIKLDIEGGELAALRGARETLRCSLPWVVAEMAVATARPHGHTIGQLLDELRPLGYRFFIIDERTGALSAISDFAPGHPGANVLCSPPGSSVSGLRVHDG